MGEANHIALDLLLRIQQGVGNCASITGSPNVIRSATPEPEAESLFTPAGICPFGEVIRVDDQYTNLDTRTIKGHDIAVYYSFETGLGNFDFRYVGVWLDDYKQKAGGQAATIVAAKDAGTLPDSVPVVGFSNLVGINGNPERKNTLRLRWNYGNWAMAATGLRYNSFVQRLSDGRDFPIDSMTTYNLSVDHSFELFDVESRVRLGINNISDERAPLADDSFGYFADQHRDLGRYYYLDLQFDLF